MNIQEFRDKHLFLEFDKVKIFASPFRGQNDQWNKEATHFQIRIKAVGKGARPEFITFYSIGSGHKGKLDWNGVLETLAMDSRVADESFQEFCENYGYSDDSIQVLEIYNATVKIANDLKATLGADVLKELQEVEF